MNLIISDEIRNAAPGYKALVITGDVVNCDTPEELLGLIDRLSKSLRETIEMSDINRRPGIFATREAYKKCGKDPNRYRPSQEALMRRIVKGNDLYRIDAVVDLVNLLSLQSGYSIGAFDLDKIKGDTLTLGIGKEGEPYEGIGRGELNIEGIPVWRDSIGGVGTPTSDNERTKIDMSTRRLLMIVNIYGEEMPVDELSQNAINLLEQFASGSNLTARVIS